MPDGSDPPPPQSLNDETLRQLDELHDEALRQLNGLHDEALRQLDELDDSDDDDAALVPLRDLARAAVAELDQQSAVTADG